VVGPRASPDSEPGEAADWSEDPEPPAGPDGTRPKPRPAADAPGQAGPLPPWARFPHVDSRRAGRAFDDGDAPVQETWAEETERILRQIDGLTDEVRSRTRTPAEPITTREPEPTESDSPEVPELAELPAASPPPAPVGLWEAPRTYLEERLRLADVDVADLGRDVRSIADTWSRVHTRMERLESEVRAAHEEMEFIHASSQGGEATPRELPKTVVAPARAPAPSPTASSTPPRAVAGPAADLWGPAPAVIYAGFTAERYNRTIGALKARRRRLAGWTFLAAGLISLALVAVTATAKEAMPPMWLALLPAVWMIPVPFFVLSFRGTQRVLRHNHLEVPGGPP
jgi:hypothetical protein